MGSNISYFLDIPLPAFALELTHLYKISSLIFSIKQ